MKLVIDTNVVISGIFWDGIPNKILLNWFGKKFKVFISESILDEYERVLKRMDSGMTDNEIRKWIRTIIDNSSAIIPTQELEVIKPDPSDNKFIECAHTSNANYIISGDKHLLRLKEYKKIKIISPSEFYNEYPKFFKG